MKLYGYYRSSTSYRLRIALELKGLAFENVPVNLLKTEQNDADFTSRTTIVRELTYAIATELHAPLNLPVLKWLKDEYRKSQDEIGVWYRHWLKRTLDPVEARLAQLGTGNFLMGAPGLFEVVLLPQVYNAQRFEYDFSASRHISAIEKACLALPAFQRAHPDSQVDAPND